MFENSYQHQRGLFKKAVSGFNAGFADGNDHLLPTFSAAINA
ncbi:hypothetical protein [Candidatus Sororendozoicomonas aggregata]